MDGKHGVSTILDLQSTGRKKSILTLSCGSLCKVVFSAFYRDVRILVAAGVMLESPGFDLEMFIMRFSLCIHPGKNIEQCVLDTGLSQIEQTGNQCSLLEVVWLCTYSLWTHMNLLLCPKIKYGNRQLGQITGQNCCKIILTIVLLFFHHIGLRLTFIGRINVLSWQQHS